MTRQDAAPGDSQVLDERLVAYLDRELSATESEAIEDRLAHDADLRDRVSRLDRVWNALDAAPRSTTDRAFAASTVAVVVEDAEAVAKSATVRASGAGRKRWRSIATLAGGLLIGFLVARGAMTRNDRQLLADLPVIQHAAALGQIEDVEYLRRMIAETPSVVAAVRPLGLHEAAEEWDRLANATPIGRAEWFAAQSEEAQTKLVEQAASFRAQSPDRRRRIIELDNGIRSEEEAVSLRVAALSHHALLSTLPAGDRAAFLSLSREERLEALRRRARRWSLEALTNLSADEAEAFAEAVDRIAASEEVAEAIAGLERLSDRLERRGPGQRRGPADAFRDQISRRVGPQIEQFRERPELLVLSVAGMMAGEGGPRWGRSSPYLQDRWREWETTLIAALPTRSRQALEAEKQPRRRARVLLTQLERVAAPARPGELSRYFAEELSNDELLEFLAMPVSEMQDRLRAEMAEEVLGGTEAFRVGPPGQGRGGGPPFPPGGRGPLRGGPPPRAPR